MANKLRLSEVYLSIQGEGPRVGERTVFVRFAGCNLKCPAWPCDTPHAIDPKIYTKDAELLEPKEVLERIQSVVGDSEANICFTGGEPFLQNADALEALVELLADDGFVSIEAFTNGTLRWQRWAYDNISFVMDWKLMGSGEMLVLNELRHQNVKDMNYGDAIKFTIASEDDLEEAIATFLTIENDTLADFYYGVVWGKMEPKDLVEKVLADKRLTSWKYTHQIHNVIWDREQRGI